LLGLIVPCPPAGPALAPIPIVWSAAPARSMRLETLPGGVDPDGRARWIVRVRFADAEGKPTKLVQAGDIEFAASHGETQWQTRSRFGGPAAIVTTTQDGPLSVRAIASAQMGLPDARAETDTRTWSVARVVARPLGPHLVQIGWFPAATQPVSVVRTGEGATRTVCTTAPPASTCRDAHVRPGASYRYSIERGATAATTVDVAVPADVARQPLDAIRGKGMWLRYSPDAADSDSFAHLDASAIVARAKRAGIRYIELRMAYGEFSEVTPAAKPSVDALIDAAADANIGVIAWTVPRAATSFDLLRTTEAATYRTPRGTPVAGLAIDLERGGEYLGDGAVARTALAAYPRLVREALGPNALIVSTVEDPYLTGLTDREFPYAAVARYSDALQPMAYWRMFRKGRGDEAGAAVVRASVAALRREAGRTIAINVGGQTAPVGSCGAPESAELLGSLGESKRSGAIGETFFDWFGTLEGQWDALGSFSW
jgi:hypothetical protein